VPRGRNVTRAAGFTDGSRGLVATVKGGHEIDQGLAKLKQLGCLAKDDFAQIPFDEEWLVGVGLLAEVAHSRQNRPRAKVLLGQLAPYASQVAVAYPEISIGSVARYLGLLASTLAHREDAARHFEDAIAMERADRRAALAGAYTRGLRTDAAVSRPVGR
jgi:hypothetical protein